MREPLGPRPDRSTQPHGTAVSLSTQHTACFPPPAVICRCRARNAPQRPLFQTPAGAGAGAGRSSRLPPIVCQQPPPTAHWSTPPCAAPDGRLTTLPGGSQTRPAPACGPVTSQDRSHGAGRVRVMTPAAGITENCTTPRWPPAGETDVCSGAAVIGACYACQRGETYREMCTLIP